MGIPLWFVLMVLAVGIAWVVLVVAWRSYTVRRRHSEWQPALSAQSEEEGVHFVTSDYPTGSRWESEARKQSHTVPKNPQDYAKIFIPSDAKD